MRLPSGKPRSGTLVPWEWEESDGSAGPSSFEEEEALALRRGPKSRFPHFFDLFLLAPERKSEPDSARESESSPFTVLSPLIDVTGVRAMSSPAEVDVGAATGSWDSVAAGDRSPANVSVARGARRGSGRGAKRILRGGESEGEASLLFEEEFELLLGRGAGRSIGKRLGVVRGVTSLRLSRMPCGWRNEEVVGVATREVIELLG